MKSSTEQELVELLQVISHDFRAPVRHLKEFSHLLFTEYPPDLNKEQTQFKDYIEESINTIDTQLERLLTYSRLNTRPPKITQESLDAIASLCTKDFSDEDKKLIQLSYNKNLNKSIINTCCNSIQIAVTEIIQNALLFSAHKPVLVRIEQNENELKILIQDSGIGIKNTKLQDEAFKLFSRLNHQSDYPGVGMGLSIAKKAIERINGSIELNSNQSHGLTVIVSTPNIVQPQ